MTEKFGTNVFAPVVAGSDTGDDMAVAYGDELGRSIHHFLDISDRDSFSSTFKSRLYHSWCVVKADSNGFAQWYEWDGTQEDGSDGKWVELNISGVVMSDSDGAIPKNIKTLVFGPDFAIQQAGDQEDAALVTYTPSSGGGNGSITLDDGTTNVAGISTLDLKGMFVTETPTSPNGVAGKAEITAGMNVTNFHNGGGSGLATKITLMPPLQTYIDPSQTGAEALIMEVTPDTYEPMNSPSFLAYLREPTKVIGKMQPDGHISGHIKGALWFDDVVVPEGSYINLDRDNKAYGIQEADNLDPNVTGGTAYLICYRVAFRGKAPADGFVRIYLREKQIGSQGSNMYLEDVNGHPMAVERFYKEDENLGHLDIIGVVKAENLIEFQCLAEDDFSLDTLNLEDRENGASGLMIQALKSDDKTSRAFLQYMHDTGQDIIFNSHYLGESRLNINWLINTKLTVETGLVGVGETMPDGLSFYNLTEMKMGVEDDHMLFTNDGTGLHLVDFHFGKIFDADETRMLRGRVITASATIIDKDAAWRIGLFKWAGKPNAYSKHIFSARNNGDIVLDAEWASVDSLLIPENVSVGDHSVTKNFTVPADANNYAVVIYPEVAKLSNTLKLKAFNVDVKKPFMGFNIHAPVLDSEKHLILSDEHKQFSMGIVPSVTYLRYTINQNDVDGLGMPIGVDKGGKASVELDRTADVANIPSSTFSDGEGCLKFTDDGKAHISTKLRLWNEKGTDTEVNFWWAKVSDDGKTLTKLPASVTPMRVKAGAKGTLYTMTYDHEFVSGERIALRASADKPDGASLQATQSVTPLISNYITYKEFATESVGDDPWGALDLSQFEHVYSHELDGRIVIRNGNSATINFVIESNMFFDVKRAIKIENGIARPVRNLDYSYNYATHELKIALGETVQEARILVGVYV